MFFFLNFKIFMEIGDISTFSIYGKFYTKFDIIIYSTYFNLKWVPRSIPKCPEPEYRTEIIRRRRIYPLCVFVPQLNPMRDSDFEKFWSFRRNGNYYLRRVVKWLMKGYRQSSESCIQILVILQLDTQLSPYCTNFIPEILGKKLATYW